VAASGGICSTIDDATGELIKKTGDFMKRMEKGQVMPGIQGGDGDTSGVSDHFSLSPDFMTLVVGMFVGCLLGIIIGFQISRQTYRRTNQYREIQDVEQLNGHA
jgi:hypothetical protein